MLLRSTTAPPPTQMARQKLVVARAVVRLQEVLMTHRLQHVVMALRVEAVVAVLPLLRQVAAAVLAGAPRC